MEPRDREAECQSTRIQEESLTVVAERQLLSVEDIGIKFGGVVALDGVSFEIREGEILALIGPNGAGKTTLFNCLSRLYQPTNGDIRIDGKSILRLPSTRSFEKV